MNEETFGIRHQKVFEGSYGKNPFTSGTRYSKRKNKNDEYQSYRKNNHHHQQHHHHHNHNHNHKHHQHYNRPVNNSHHDLTNVEEGQDVSDQHYNQKQNKPYDKQWNKSHDKQWNKSHDKQWNKSHDKQWNNSHDKDKSGGKSKPLTVEEINSITNIDDIYKALNVAKRNRHGKCIGLLYAQRSRLMGKVGVKKLEEGLNQNMLENISKALSSKKSNLESNSPKHLERTNGKWLQQNQTNDNEEDMNQVEEEYDDDDDNDDNDDEEEEEEEEIDACKIDDGELKAYQMMLNMGYQVGTGLGVKEQGMKEPIPIDLSRTNKRTARKGLGFSSSRN